MTSPTLPAEPVKCGSGSGSAATQFKPGNPGKQAGTRKLGVISRFTAGASAMLPSLIASSMCGRFYMTTRPAPMLR